MSDANQPLPTPSSTSLATLPGAERAVELRREIAEIESDLAPITPLAAAKAVALMLKAYGMAAGGEDESLARLYLKATEGQSAKAVEKLCEDIALGRVEGVSLDFPPKVPKFANLCRNRSAGFQVRLNNRCSELERLLRPRVVPERKRPQPGPERSVEEAREEARQVGATLAHAREERVAADLANRNFPPAPSELQAPAEAGKDVA